jgi:uncharacterized protein YbjT (DUF2867 family)
VVWREGWDVHLVVGASGLLGGRIARALLDRGEAVRALVRDRTSVASLMASGVEPVDGDLKDPTSLQVACEGATTVVTTANSTQRGGEDTVESVDLHGNAALIDAAVAAGVERFVFVSALSADTKSPVPFLAAKGATEQRLNTSGMTWTVLRPDSFMDVWVPMVVGGPALSGRPVTLVRDASRVHAMVAVDDIAAYAVAATAHPGAANTVLPIGGPEPVSWRDVVAGFEAELGREIPIRWVDAGEPVPGLPPAVHPMMWSFEAYDSPLDTRELAATFGVEQRSLSDFIRGFVAAGT